MKPRFLFPNSYKKYGVILSIPFLILGFACLFFDFEFDWLNFNLPYSYTLFSDLGIDTKSINLTNEIATIGLIISLLLVAFSKVKFEDEYVAKIRLESLQWAIYINFALLIVLTIFVFGLLYFYMVMVNIFTLLIIFIIRFHYLLFIKNESENNESSVRSIAL